MCRVAASISPFMHQVGQLLAYIIEGAAYYERILRVLVEIDNMESDVTNAQASHRGRLRVDIGSSLANRILIPRLSASATGRSN